MGEGPECCRRAEWPLGRRLERVTALVPLLLTGVRHHPPGRTDKNLCRCFGAPACRVFPDHLITWLLAPNRFIGSGRHAHGGWSSSWCEVARPSLRSVQVV